MEEGAYMTQKDLNIAEILSRVSRQEISQVRAAKEIGISLRHLQRIYKKFREQGACSLASKRRGKPSSNRLSAVVKARVLELVTCENYTEFCPTFMTEKLEQYHQIKISRETTRQLMIESGVWHPKRKKIPVIHQQRERRHCLGELIQVDGSPHLWFEGRDEPCTLLVYIDDATGRTYGRFAESETTAAYMVATKEYIKKYGLPLAFYSDKYSVFRINMPGSTKRESLTQFARALKELEIRLIYANSPQAKGRVERANKTLQDRLVKELRLRNISSIEEGNRYLPEFFAAYNERFMVKPKDSRDLHRPALSDEELDKILCLKEYRKVSKAMEIQYKNVIYQITTARSMDLRKQMVLILEDLDGKILGMEYKGKTLSFKVYAEQESYGEIADVKEIERFLKRPVKTRHPGYDHPWIKQGRAEVNRRAYMTL